jgi:hypothetical protein
MISFLLDMISSFFSVFLKIKLFKKLSKKLDSILKLYTISHIYFQ